MNLIDEDRASEIYAMMGPATEMSGGSVANSIAGFANLGGAAAYIGRVKDDQFGEVFNHDMRSLGVDVRLAPGVDGAPTARSHILITNDGQRTMNTYLGACTELSVNDISTDTIGSPKAILLEGYVWDCPEGPALARKAIDIAGECGAAIALSLSDSFCVDRHRASFEHFVVTAWTSCWPTKSRSTHSCKQPPSTRRWRPSSHTPTCLQLHDQKKDL
jgi:sugar/nucleoside kinase (ribokinase family)